MRIPRNVLVLSLLPIGFCLLAVIAWWLWKPAFRRFMEDKDPQYYSQFAGACDAVLSQHPLRANEFIRIPGTDPSLPKIIQDLHPEKVTVSPQRVHLVVGAGREAFGIACERGDQVHWKIITFVESKERVAYAPPW